MNFTSGIFTQFYSLKINFIYIIYIYIIYFEGVNRVLYFLELFTLQARRLSEGAFI